MHRFDYDMTLDQDLLDRPDDTLLSTWRDGRPEQGALSVSSAKTVLEDSHKWFLQKVEGHREPPTVPLAQGSATHHSMESLFDAQGVRAAIDTYRASLTKSWPTVRDQVVKVNPKDPSQPAGKEPVPTTLKELLAVSERDLRWILSMLHNGWDAYTVTTLLARIRSGAAPPARIERELGETAQTHGMPWAMARAWDYDVNDGAGGWTDKAAAVVAGILMQGKVDLETVWVDGSPVILDHKTVSNVVPFWGYGRSPFECSYDAADDLQLDTYSAATGITRCGFQFILKHPQYVPDRGPLRDLLQAHWLDERDWKARRTVVDRNNKRIILPMAWARNQDDELRYVAVWRPTPSEHPSLEAMGDAYPYTHDKVYAKAARKLRLAAEFLTESLLLVEAGVDPAVAFPVGDPDDIGRKACPSCEFRAEADGGTGDCRMPMTLPKEGRAKVQAALVPRRRAVLEAREQICLQTPAVRERRKAWSANPFSSHHAAR